MKEKRDPFWNERASERTSEAMCQNAGVGGFSLQRERTDERENRRERERERPEEIANARVCLAQKFPKKKKRI